MPRLRIAGRVLDAAMRGSAEDYCDTLAALARSSIRQMIASPALAAEMVRRVFSPPCASTCSIEPGAQGGWTLRPPCFLCTGSGFQYTSDEDEQQLEGCKPQDVWSDATSLLAFHKLLERGDKQPILVDCDDLALIEVAVLALVGWGYMPRIASDPTLQLGLAITDPEPATPDNMAHAYVLLNRPPSPPQPPIRLGSYWVLDPSAHFGMPRPRDTYYAGGRVAFRPIVPADLHSQLPGFAG